MQPELLRDQERLDIALELVKCQREVERLLLRGHDNSNELTRARSDIRLLAEKLTGYTRKREERERILDERNREEREDKEEEKAEKEEAKFAAEMGEENVDWKHADRVRHRTLERTTTDPVELESDERLRTEILFTKILGTKSLRNFQPGQQGGVVNRTTDRGEGEEGGGEAEAIQD
jgi:hypothetical protein